MDVCALSAVELRAALRRGELSAVDALEAVLERADEIAATFNPFTIRLDSAAREAAKAADEALSRGEGGPLCGIPVTTKDSHWMSGVESTSGSRARRGFVPAETTASIERLQAAGAVIFARTTTPEFCYFGVTESALFGRTSNPWNLGRTPGGSSGGAAAAVASGCGPLSLGGDGGGSIRIPAAAGVQLVPGNPGLGTSAAIWSAIALAEARYSEAGELAEHRADLTDAAVEFIEAGGEVTAEQYIRAQFAREHIHRAYADLFARTGATALITPALGCEAFPHGLGHPEAIGGVAITPPDFDWAPFLYDANLAGLPACALPMGLGDDGLPVSMQVLGMRCADDRVLAAAQTIEGVLGFDAHPPAQGGRT